MPLILFFYSLSFLLTTSVNKWFVLWMILELNTISFIGILMIYNYFNFIEKTIMYFMVQTMTSLVLLMAMANMLFTSTTMPLMGMFLIAMLMKMSAAPFHLWVVPVANQMGWLTFFLLMSMQKIIPLILLEIWSPLMSWLWLSFCIWSWISGTMMNFMSTSLKSILIYTSIASMGWLLLSVTTSMNLWKMYFIIFLVNFLFIAQEPNKITKINQKLSVMVWFNLLSMGGLPPLMGFFPKFLILSEMLNNALITVTMLVVSLSVMEMFIYIKLSSSPGFYKLNTKKWKKKYTQQPVIFFIFLNTLFFSLM